MRYTDCPNVTKTSGVWPACGINEANVAMTATETITSNSRAIGADPYVEYSPKKGRNTKEIPGGIGEEDLVTLVLPYIHSAREGVLRTGALLEQYGTYEANGMAFADAYEANGMAFADAEEIWWLETIGGHHWIARRVPDDRVVIMPNQFGLDNFDFADAYGEGREHLCSADLQEFVKKHRLALDLTDTFNPRLDGEGREHLCSADLQEFVKKHRLALDLTDTFNPRLAFGSHSDSDHIYNTPRAWFMARYFLPRTYRWEGDQADFTPESDDIPWSFVPERKVTVIYNTPRAWFMARYFLPRTYRWEGDQADFTPESDDIPWSFVPERKVTVEDVRYLLGSYYQGTPYNPYGRDAAQKGKYRTIGVPNSDVCGIMQIRGDLPQAIQGVQWLSMGGSGFTACFPVYANVSRFPKYISGTTETVSTDSMYWHSRLIAALTDAHMASALLYDERYVNAVMNKGQQFLYEYDEKISQGADRPDRCPHGQRPAV